MVTLVFNIFYRAVPRVSHRRANEEAVDTEGGIGLEHMPGDGLTAIVASVRREAARRLDLGPRL